MKRRLLTGVQLDDATVGRIAAESEESIVEREDLTKKLKILGQTMDTLKRLRTIRHAGTQPRAW